MHLRVLSRRLAGRTRSYVVRKKSAAQVKSADGVKGQTGLAAAGRPDLSCSVTHAVHITAPGSSTVHQKTAVPGSRPVEIPTTYVKLSRRGSFLQCVPPPQNPHGCDIMPDKRRCRLAPYLSQRAAQISLVVTRESSFTWSPGGMVLLQLCPRPRPREPAFSSLAGHMRLAATPPCPSPRFVQSCSSLFPLSQPAKRVRGPPFFSQVASSRLPKSIYPVQAWTAARR